ncbi:MAG: substrate-binding domain-containing protein, partial [Oscillospiraceae bacterium]
NDSTAGMTAAAEGTCDIGMSSRALKDSELSSLTPIQIATDGIAIIVNPKSPVSELTHAQIKDIYTGAITTWAALAK